MSKNLRPRKGTAHLEEEMPTDSNFEELTKLVKSLATKIDKLIQTAKVAMMSCALNFSNSSPKQLACRVRLKT